jgi:hypothetical protein
MRSPFWPAAKTGAAAAPYLLWTNVSGPKM